MSIVTSSGKVEAVKEVGGMVKRFFEARFMEVNKVRLILEWVEFMKLFMNDKTRLE